MDMNAQTLTTQDFLIYTGEPPLCCRKLLFTSQRYHRLVTRIDVNLFIDASCLAAYDTADQICPRICFISMSHFRLHDK